MRRARTRALPAIAAFLLAGSGASMPASAAERAPIVQPSPGTPWTSASVAALRSDLDAMLASSDALAGAHYGVYAVDTSSGRVLYAHLGDAEFQAASTFKLIVGSAALDRLGPSFRFTTTMSLARERIVPSGVPPPIAQPSPAPSPGVAANGLGPAVDVATPVPTAAPWPPSLVMTFGGDPTFTRGDLASAVATLTNPSIDQTYVDDSAFDTTPYSPGWTWDDFGQEYAAKISAATIDENVYGISVSPGGDVGDPVTVRNVDGHPFFVPPPKVVDDCDGMHTPLDFIRSRAITGTAASDDSIDVAPFLNGCARLIGSIPLGAKPETVGIAMADPVRTIAAMLDRDIAARSIARPPSDRLVTIDSPEAYAPRPNLKALIVDPPMWKHTSQQLGDLLGPNFWIPSDNLFGELLLKQLGLQTGGKPGTTLKGIAFEKQWLHTLGIDTNTLTMADACGMSQYDRVTPHDLVAILQHDWNGPNRQLVLDSLPVGGSRGTIEGIAGTPVAGRVFAKTGSMMHVRGLAGYLSTVRHGPVTFAFSVDDWNGDYASLAALRARVLSRISGD